MQVLTVGRPKAAWCLNGVDEYRRRLSKPWAWDWVAVSDRKARTGQVARALQMEGADLMRHVQAHHFVVVLDVDGERVDSMTLARRIENCLGLGQPPAFVIGSSFGLSDDVKRRADWRWSLSPLTFPHDLVLVMVAEQLYRAYTIAHGSPYHKA